MDISTIRLPPELAAALDRVALLRGKKRSAVMREALIAYCDEQEKRHPVDRLRLLRKLVKYPGSGRGDLGTRGEHYLREMFDARRRSR